MDDGNGNIMYYLVLGIIYILSRVFGKKKKKPVPQKSKREIVPPTSGKEEAASPPMSFEDILRELSGTPQPKPEPIPEPETEPILEEPVYSADAIDDIAIDYKVPNPIAYETFKEPKSVASTRDQDKFVRDDSYRIKEKEEINYISVLNEVNGPAKAFVLSEIFQKKY